MDWAQWSSALIAGLIGSVVGSLSTVGVEWFRLKTQHARDRRDRRDDFQRTTLMALQEAMMSSTSVVVAARNATEPFGPAGDQSIHVEPAANKEMLGLSASVVVLQARIDDDQVRNLVGDFGDAMLAITKAQGLAAYDEAWTELERAHVETNLRIGEVLRSL